MHQPEGAHHDNRLHCAATGGPKNMSAAVETWMQDTANELERHYNDGEMFRMPPVSRRRRPAT